MLRKCPKNLEEFRHPKLLQVYSTVKECTDTLAFATEPVLGSLANVLAYREQQATSAAASAAIANSSQQHNYNTGHHQQNPAQHQQQHRPVMIKKYDMVATEIKYGLLQVKIITKTFKFHLTFIYFFYFSTAIHYKRQKQFYKFKRIENNSINLQGIFSYKVCASI